MNLRQLRYFLAIVEEGSVTRAAQRLFVAQPSISQQMRALEAELGGQLLERLPTGVRPTAAGRAFLVEARAAVEHADKAHAAARVTLGLEGGELQIATVTSVAYGLLLPVLARWKSVYPNSTLRLRDYGHREELHSAVRSGVAELAIGPAPSDWNGPLISLGWERFLFVLSASDPLAACSKSVRLEALADRDWVTFPTDHGLSELIRSVCAKAGFTPRAAVENGQVATVAHLAASGLGVTLLPENVIPSDVGAAVRAPHEPIVRELTAFTRADPSVLAAAFVKMLQEHPWPSQPNAATVVS
jgi:DNA-binding transcriptional LysR family regulator